MAIEINPKTKVEMTEKGPAPVEPGVATPKMDTPADYDAILAAARRMMERNTEKTEEEPVAKTTEGAPKLPEGVSEGEFLQQQAAKSGGSPKRRLEKAAEFKLGPRGDKYGKITDAVSDFGKKWSQVKSSFSGLVIKDENEQDVDLAGDIHKHVDNIISQAQRHIEAAGQKEMRGYQAPSEDISEQLKSSSPVNVARRIFPNRSGSTTEFNDLSKYAPLRLDPGQEAPPAESESLSFLGTYANNSFIKTTHDFAGMTPADHVDHARNLLAGLTVSIPELSKQIHADPMLKAQMAKSGKIGMTPEETRKLLNPSLLKVHEKAEDYMADVNAGQQTTTNQPVDKIYGAFGLDHHLKRLSALANSKELQRSTEQRFGIIKNAYQQKYGALLAKRKGTITTTAQPGYEFGKDGKEVQSSTEAPTLERALGPVGSRTYSREALANTFSFASEDTLNKLHNAALSGSSDVDALELQAKQEHLTGRANSLSELATGHPMESRWRGLLDRVSKINTSYVGRSGSVYSPDQEITRAHALLDKIKTSMQKNGVAPLESRTVARPRSATDPIPTLSEYAGLAKMGSPVRQSESFLRTGEHEAEVDPTMGGLKGADEPMTMLNAFGYTGNPPGSRVTSETITSPSASGFHVPSDAEVSAFNMKKRETRRAAAASAAARAKATADNRSPVDPWLYGPGPAAINFSDVRVEPVEDGNQTVSRRKKTSIPIISSEERGPGNTGSKWNSVSLDDLKSADEGTYSANSEGTKLVRGSTTSVPGTESGASAEERAASLFNPGSRPRGR